MNIFDIFPCNKDVNLKTLLIKQLRRPRFCTYLNYNINVKPRLHAPCML